jgi:hypothetical protein
MDFQHRTQDQRQSLGEQILAGWRKNQAERQLEHDEAIARPSSPSTPSPSGAPQD